MRFCSTTILILLTACNGTSSAGDTSADTFDDAALAADLWTAIQDYDSWSHSPGTSDTPAFSQGHQAWVESYDNDALAAWDRTGDAPSDAIGVKENFSDDAGTTLVALTVMEKIDGYDPEDGDWFWAKYDPDGTVLVSGEVDACYSCHALATHDYVYR